VPNKRGVVIKRRCESGEGGYHKILSYVHWGEKVPHKSGGVKKMLGNGLIMCATFLLSDTALYVLYSVHISLVRGVNYTCLIVFY